MVDMDVLHAIVREKTCQPNGHVYAFRYEENPHLRTLNETIEYGRRGNSGPPVMGVKGSNAFSKIMPDFVRGMAIDRMRGIEGGIVKKMLSLLFDPAFSAFPFSLTSFKNIIDTRLTNIKPLKFVHRMPRSVSDLMHWKASELKMWFFYYSYQCSKVFCEMIILNIIFSSLQ